MMSIEEIAALLTRIQAHDNRRVDELTIEAWGDAIIEAAPSLTYEAAVSAVNRHFATSTEYLKLAHITELAGAVDESPSPWRDWMPEIIAADRQRQLEAAGVTEEEFEAHKSDRAWLAAHFPAEIEAPNE